MKIEFQHQWQRRHGLALRDRIVATLPRWAPLASRAGPLLDARNRIGGVAALTESMTGIAKARSTPRWTTRPFYRDRAARIHDPSPNVVLFVDTFTHYFEPENAHAALAVLRAAGYRVAVASEPKRRRPLCCGRTLLTYGRIDEARAEASRLLEAVAPYVARGVAVVGLEPSCTLTLRDEFLALNLGETANRVATSTYLIEEFLMREQAHGKLSLALDPLPQDRALVHAHCHQKAFDAAGAIVDVLRLVPDLAVEAIESSCCGMAGAFGYTTDHYEISMRMAEASLLPVVRNADQNTLIVADGTSCRHQIADGTRATGRREAVHAVQVLQCALATRTGARGGQRARVDPGAAQTT